MGSFGDGHVVWPLVFSSSGVWGEVYIGDERWALRGIGRGKTAVFRTDDSEAPPEEPAGWLSRMAVSKIASADSAAKRTGKGDQRGRNRILTGDPEIKVLLLYSEETSDNIESEVATAEAYANTSFTNSRLDFISVDIVAVEVEPLHEPTVSQNGVDSLQAGLVYENVETLRTSYNADIVGYVSMDNNARGIAKEILASASNAYVIVSKDFLPSLTFTHEIGHLAGALHTASWMQGYIPGYVWNDSEDNPWGASLGSYSNHAVDSYFLGSHHLSVMTTSLSRLPYWSSLDLPW
jgi:hypothetical protein